MSIPFKQPQDYGLWRFGIISPLLHRSEDAPIMRIQIEDLAQHMFYTPHGRETRLCPNTIRDWLSRYRTRGIDGLRNKTRKDRGGTTVPESLAQALVELRKTQPRWTFKRLLGSMRNDGLWDGCKPSRSALYRYATAHGLNRTVQQPLLPVRSFEYPYFGDMWVADFMHGPMVRIGAYAQKSYLLAIIDDATRYIVAARFHRAEDTRSLLDDFMLALRRFGIPKRFYTDNGAAFRSRHLRLVAAKLGVSLPHTPPYTPQGRGKIERLFRSIQDSLITGRARTSLDKLNTDLAAWIHQYHNTHHRILEVTPLQRKLTDTGPALKQIAPTRDIDDIFRMEQPKRIGSDGCVRLFNKRFEIPNALPGTIVTVFYLPWDETRIFIGDDRQALSPLDTTGNALRFDKPRRGKPHNTNQEDAHDAIG
jgi:putative transposase